MENNTQTQSPYISLEFCFFQQDFSQIPIARKDLGSTGTFINYSMVVAGTSSSELLSNYMDSQGVSKIVNTLYRYKLTGNFGVFSYLFKKAEGKSDGTTSRAWLANGNATSYRVENLKQGEEKMSETNNNEIPNTESKKLESKTQENRKLDSNGDEIIWELEMHKNVFFWLWSWIAKIGAMIFCIYFIFIYLNLTNWSDFIILLVLVSIILYVVITSYTTLNLKGMYCTKNNFYIEKYFGESISLPLGSFYIALRLGDYSFQTLAFITRLSIILFINNKRKYYCEFSIVKDNFDILEKNLKRQTEFYLMSLDEKDYATIFIPNIKYDIDRGYTAKIDFDKIEKLRKEKENGK